MKYIFLVLSFVLLTSCKAQKNQSPYSSIEVETLGCRGFCPIYKISINPTDLSVILEAERFNFADSDRSKDYEGTFKTQLNAAQLKSLISLINSMDPKKMKDYYGDQRQVDLPTAFLRLVFKNGSRKQVEDWGKRGTPELQKLYQWIEELKQTQKWTKVSDVSTN